jgi:glycosyltransferase involved in cell wall biosynthesis
MKVLLIHNYYRFRGGEDRYVGILADLLEKEGHRVTGFFSDSRDIESFNLFQKLLIPLRLIRSRSVDRKLEEAIDKEQPDLAIVHNLFPLFSLSLLKVLKRKRIPVLKRLENYKFLCLNGLFLRNNFRVCEVCKQGNFFPGIFHRCYQRSFFKSLGIALSEFLHRRRRTVVRYSDQFLATSGFVKSKFVEAGFPNEKISVFPNFIDFEPLESTVPPENYAVYVGRLSREKGLVTLLSAFEKLRDLPLKIVGDGPLKNELERIVHRDKLNHVTFTGFIDGAEKREILAKALFLVFPSQCYESFGYSIIESYACGVPVVASDIGGAMELVDEGNTGVLFQPKNPSDLTKKISSLLEDRNRLLDMRQHALEKAKQLYTKETGYRNLEGLFQQLLHGQTGKSEQENPR